MPGTRERIGTLALALIVAAAAGVVAVGIVRARRAPPAPIAGQTDAAASRATERVDAAAEPVPATAVANAAVAGAADADADAGARNAGETPDAGTACERLAATNRERLGKALAATDAGCPEQSLDGFACIDAHGVTWGWRLSSAAVARNGDSEYYCSTTLMAELTRDADGGATALPKEEAKYDWTTRTERRELTAVADYDGDGLDEILAVHESLYHEGVPAHEARLLTFKNGAIVPYGPAKGIVIESLEDVDGDGRADLMTRGPFKAKRTDGIGNQWPIAPAIFAAHARPDGTFSRDDDAARARAHKSCPARPALTLTGEDPDALTIMCARLWGVPTPLLVKEIRTVCPEPDAEPTGTTCRAWEESLANTEPPFRLDRRK